MAELSRAQLEAYDPQGGRKGGKNRRYLCPFCGDGHKKTEAQRSLSLNTNTGAWTCHRCAEKGLLEDFKTDRPMPPTPRLKRNAFTLPPRAEKVPPAPVEDAPYDFAAILAGLARDPKGPHIAYLVGRGIPPELAHRLAGYHATPPGIGPSVAFPLHLVEDPQKLAGLALREIQGTNRRMYRKLDGPRAFFTSRNPYDPGSLPIVITEAPIDALSAATVGVPAIATNGTVFPDGLAAHLKCRAVILAYDADKAGQDAANKAAAVLDRWGCIITRATLPEGVKDLNETLQRGGLEAVGEALGDPYAAP